MPYSVKIIKDSIAPCDKRLTTWELQYPRFVHAELMTHRWFSRNSASSRAIPTAKLIQRVIDDPAMPVWWGKNQSGMQAAEELSDDHWAGNYPASSGGGPRQGMSERADAQRVWLDARDAAVAYTRKLNEIGLHKQIANRCLEPFMFITVIVTATEFGQWFHQRYHKDAQPEIKWVAEHMWPMYETAKPDNLKAGDWHLPLIDKQDWDDALAIASGDEDNQIEMVKQVSVGRCARVSYLTHDGKRDLKEDIALHDRLAGARPGHWSPFEHVARALEKPEQHGNFIGWKQYRKFFGSEHHAALPTFK